MKRILTLALLLCSVFTLWAQEDYNEAKPYYTPEQMPDMIKWLPAPPAVGSEAFKYDVSVYEAGKIIRQNDAEAAAAAKAQSDNRMTNISKQFSAAFGHEISAEKTPEIYILLRDAVITCVKTVVGPKNHYSRLRPFVHFNEPTLMPDSEGWLHKSGSFPSGHTLRGWVAALVLSEVNPAAADELLKVGYQYGQSRIISGYHWQSDVDAARLVAAGAVAQIHAHPRFVKQMKRAKREFKRLS